MLSFSGLSRERNGLATLPTVLKTQSDGVFVAQTQKCFGATLDIRGKWVLFNFYQRRGSSSPWTTGSWQYAVSSAPACSLTVLGCPKLTFSFGVEFTQPSPLLRSPLWCFLHLLMHVVHPSPGSTSRLLTASLYLPKRHHLAQSLARIPAFMDLVYGTSSFETANTSSLQVLSMGRREKLVTQFSSYKISVKSPTGLSASWIACRTSVSCHVSERLLLLSSDGMCLITWACSRMHSTIVSLEPQWPAQSWRWRKNILLGYNH